jgi:hypothetical protein
MEGLEDGRIEAIKPEKHLLQKPKRRRSPGRGIGEKRLTEEALQRLDTIFENLQIIRRFLKDEGHQIINDSGSLLTPQAHQNLDQMLLLLEDFLWILNCAIAKYGGKARLF